MGLEGGGACSHSHLFDTHLLGIYYTPGRVLGKDWLEKKKTHLLTLGAYILVKEKGFL